MTLDNKKTKQKLKKNQKYEKQTVKPITWYLVNRFLENLESNNQLFKQKTRNPEIGQLFTEKPRIDRSDKQQQQA